MASNIYEVVDTEAREQIAKILNEVNLLSGQLIKISNEVETMSALLSGTSKPLVLYADNAEDYKTNSTIGDETLNAIL